MQPHDPPLSVADQLVVELKGQCIFMSWNLPVPASVDGHATDAPLKAPLTQLLCMNPRFDPAFEDKVAAVFIAHVPQTKPALATVRLGPEICSRSYRFHPELKFSCAS